jgi:putative nucleotidyltransferase with HDIG domain
MFLGLETIEAIVVSIEAFARFDKTKPHYFTADRVWKHSQSLADSAKKISRLTGGSRDEVSQSYLAALLHDIGKLALAENFPDEYNEVTQSAEKQKRFVFEVETEKFGASHAEAGAYLLALWDLPGPIVQAVSSHHAGFGSFNSQTPASIVHFTEQLFATREPVDDLVKRYAPDLGFRDALDQIRLLAPLRMKTSDSGATGQQTTRGSVRSGRNEGAFGRLFGGLGRLLSR